MQDAYTSRHGSALGFLLGLYWFLLGNAILGLLGLAIAFAVTWHAATLRSVLRGC
jgi:hypothetical protein